MNNKMYELIFLTYAYVLVRRENYIYITFLTKHKYMQKKMKTNNLWHDFRGINTKLKKENLEHIYT